MGLDASWEIARAPRKAPAVAHGLQPVKPAKPCWEGADFRRDIRENASACGNRCALPSVNLDQLHASLNKEPLRLQISDSY